MMGIITAAIPVVVALLIVDVIRYGHRQTRRIVRNLKDK